MVTYNANKVASASKQARQANPVSLNAPTAPAPPKPTGSAMLPNSGFLPAESSIYRDINGYRTGDYSDVHFSAGGDPDDGNLFFGLTLADNNPETAAPDESDDEYAMPLPQRIIRSLAAESLNAGALKAKFKDLQHNTNWSPHGSKIMFLLDLLDNIPRLRLSTEHLELIVWIMREAGCDDLPSVSQLRETQNRLRQTCAIKSHEYRSSQGNCFTMLDIPQLVGRDYSNPMVAPHINIYPEDSGDYLSESWQAKKWRDEVPLEHLTPMYAQGSKHYYVNELARLHDGTFVIPKRWIIRNNILTADCWPVDWVTDPSNEGNTGLHVSQEEIHIPATSFSSNYYDIVDHTDPSHYSFAAPFQSFQENMPNPLRKLTNGREELVSSFIKPWCDDVSGGRTKQYQPHNNIYLGHANLPGSFLNQEYFVRFVSTATHASSVEQFEAVKQQIEANNQNPVRVFNAATARWVRLRIYVLNVPGDNRAQSEVASHMCGGNFPCRKCKVGGSYHETETEQGFSAFFEPGQPRTVAETVREIRNQLETACLGVASHVGTMQTNSGVKDPTAQSIITELIRRGKEIKDSQKQPRKRITDDAVMAQQAEWLKTQPAEPFNVLFQIYGLDPHRDTPIEILHTILLGVEKYAWYAFHSSTKPEAHKTFEARLQSADIRGLEVDNIRANYIVRYKNNLIGRHFKSLMQLTVFQVHDLVSADVFSLIKAVGNLGAVLWFSEIDNLELYLTDLSVLINNVLDAFTKLDPARVIDKLKLHILTHLPEDIRRHGPAIRYSTEVFECYNGVFRMCSILSNHQAPSRDIAAKMIELERFRHIVCGGYWQTPDGAVCASDEVRQFFQASLHLQTYLGWVKPKEIQPGKYKRTVQWDDTTGSAAGDAVDHSFFRERTWNAAKSVVAINGDECAVGSWVVSTHSESTIIGRILEIWLESESTANGIVVIDRFDVAEQRHSVLDMPMLVQKDTSDRYITVVSCYHIDFAINVQHDCLTLSCPCSAVETIWQERRNTMVERQKVEHKPDPIFIVNMHALHNARRLRQLLPRSLTKPVPMRSGQSRQDFLAESARELHKKQSARRAERDRKRKAAREARQRDAEAEGGGA
ncbi:hypothetical protein FRC09_008469 [Ceratobasidium sp. 395]|nr:hypothetical protein FRC09_008469 [Ceratobasidium sp. 395]